MRFVTVQIRMDFDRVIGAWSSQSPMVSLCRSKNSSRWLHRAVKYQTWPSGISHHFLITRSLISLNCFWHFPFVVHSFL